MKRIIATLLLLTLALTLTACAALSPAAPRKTFARGTWDGNTFVSEFAELTLTLPESGWTISTDEEIADQMGISRDLLDSTELEDAIMDCEHSLPDIPSICEIRCSEYNPQKSYNYICCNHP